MVPARHRPRRGDVVDGKNRPNGVTLRKDDGYKVYVEGDVTEFTNHGFSLDGQVQARVPVAGPHPEDVATSSNQVIRVRGPEGTPVRKHTVQHFWNDPGTDPDPAFRTSTETKWAIFVRTVTAATMRLRTSQEIDPYDVAR